MTGVLGHGLESQWGLGQTLYGNKVVGSWLWFVLKSGRYTVIRSLAKEANIA